MQVCFGKDFYTNSSQFFFITRQFLRPDIEPYPEHNHDFFEFFLVDSGRVQHRFNGRETILGAGAPCLVRPQDVHLVRCAPGMSEAVIYNCNIRTEEFTSLLHFLTNPDHYPIDDIAQFTDLDGSVEFRGLQDKLQRLAAMELNVRIPLVQKNCFYRSILLDILAVFVLKTQWDHNHAPEWLDSLMLEMRRPENLLAGLPRMLALAGRSQEHLCRTMRSYYGLSPSRYLLDLKLDMVAGLLIHSSIPVTEAAFRAGFNNLAYFRKSFLEKYKLTPREYRKSIGGKP